MLRNSQLSDVTKQFNLISFGQIQQTYQQPQQLQQLQQPEQTYQQPQQPQQLQQPQQQPNDETLGHDEFINFRPPNQTDEIQILTATPPTNLQTVGLFSDIEDFMVNFSHSLQPFNLNSQ